jgi:hypothetical protein
LQLFRVRGAVQPGLICSRVRPQRESFSTIDATVAVHTKGLGCVFQARKNSSMTCSKPSTLQKAPAADALGGQLAKPALDQIEPT